jgi:hypothetical protein
MIKGAVFTVTAKGRKKPEKGSQFPDYNYLGYDRIEVLEVREESRVTYQCQPCGHIDWDDESKNTATRTRTEWEYICWADHGYLTVCKDEMDYLIIAGHYETEHHKELVHGTS